MGSGSAVAALMQRRHPASSSIKEEVFHQPNAQWTKIPCFVSNFYLIEGRIIFLLTQYILKKSLLSSSFQFSLLDIRFINTTYTISYIRM